MVHGPSRIGRIRHIAVRRSRGPGQSSFLSAVYFIRAYTAYTRLASRPLRSYTAKVYSAIHYRLIQLYIAIHYTQPYATHPSVRNVNRAYPGNEAHSLSRRTDTFLPYAPTERCGSASEPPCGHVLPAPHTPSATSRSLPTPPKAAAAAGTEESCGLKGTERQYARGGAAPLRRGLRLRGERGPPPALLGERALTEVLEGERCRGAVHACACEYGAETLLAEESLLVRRVGRRRPGHHGKAVGSHLVGLGLGSGPGSGSGSGPGLGSGPGSGSGSRSGSGLGSESESGGGGGGGGGGGDRGHL